MSSTHLSLHYHVVFSTKERHPLIVQEWRDRLHAYLGGIIRDIGGVPECIGGVADHVHLMIGLKATHRLCDVIRDIKVSSSKWIHDTLALREFAWQDGYGAFTVSENRRESVKRYIQNQEAHHKIRAFEDEYLTFLRQAGVEFDERFLW